MCRSGISTPLASQDFSRVVREVDIKSRSWRAGEAGIFFFHFESAFELEPINWELLEMLIMENESVLKSILLVYLFQLLLRADLSRCKR